MSAALQAAGLGASVWPTLHRKVVVPKSAWAARGERPTVEAHITSLDLTDRIPLDRRLLRRRRRDQGTHDGGGGDRPRGSIARCRDPRLCRCAPGARRISQPTPIRWWARFCGLEPTPTDNRVRCRVVGVGCARRLGSDDSSIKFNNRPVCHPPRIGAFKNNFRNISRPRPSKVRSHAAFLCEHGRYSP